jgi:catechol 2,3-dioxygenase-like lactoylglutathione lyase family enzyme
MLSGIDHVIVACADPEAAVLALERELGLSAGGGGRHETSGTFNRLVWLGDSYLELVGVFDVALAEDGMFGRHISSVLRGAPAGFAGVALATSDLAAGVAQLRGMGSAIADPLDGERLRSDGRVVRWRTGRLAAPDPDLGLAFLIEHDTSAAEWSDADRAERAADTHPLGTPARLARLVVPVSSTSRATQRLHRDLGLAFRPSLAGRGARDTSIGAQTLRLVPSIAGVLPTIVIRAGAEPRETTLLGCRWILEPVVEP